jgi:hypothetical protein
MSRLTVTGLRRRTAFRSKLHQGSVTMQVVHSHKYTHLSDPIRTAFFINAVRLKPFLQNEAKLWKGSSLHPSPP